MTRATAGRGGPDLDWVAQVITFYAPSFWGLDSDEQLSEYARSAPREFFDRLLDAIAQTGVRRIELCMAPGDWQAAREAFGGGAATRAALAGRDMVLTGSYQSGWPLEEALADRSARVRALDNVARHADFLHDAGVDLMLTGPLRRGTVEGSIFPRVSDAVLDDTAEIISELATITAQRGVDLAIHTEAYSVVCREEDIDRIMARTEEGLVYLCPDSGHITLDGGDVAAVVRSHLPRIRSMHWKDCIGPRMDLPASGAVTHEMMMEQFRRMGKGAVDWEGVIDAFAQGQFAGYAVAEIDLAPDPIGDVRDIIDYYEDHVSATSERSADA